MTTKIQYSEKEMQLIKELRYEDIAASNSVMPPMLYNCMAIECFRQNRNDKVSDSVRRCLWALERSGTKDNGNPIHRLTKEFDDLIVI